MAQHILETPRSRVIRRQSRVVRRAEAMMADIFGPPAKRSFDVRYWDGSVEHGRNNPAFTLHLKRPGALRRMLLPPSEMSLGEAYLRDDFDIEGDIEVCVECAGNILNRLSNPQTLLHLVRNAMALPSDDMDAGGYAEAGVRRHVSGGRHTKRRDALAVRSHYNTGNDFYALWLDKRMVYSCAYFPNGDEDLDAAQTAKLEHICRKLRLQPGERLLDIGCGWGGLVMYAAEKYGVQALGVTLSQPQAEFARKRIAEAGLSDRCSVEVRDYRDLAGSGIYDKIVSVGMVEHVGHSRLPVYFATAYRLLKPGGLFLNHGIVCKGQRPLPGVTGWFVRNIWRPGAFIGEYVFPDGELLTPAETIRVGEEAGFEIRAVESLREHYATTLRHWVRRLEEHHAEAVEQVGETTYRVWRLYMAGSANTFATAANNIIQSVFAKPDHTGKSNVSRTWAHVYR